MSTTIAIDVREATDAQLQEALERIHKELRIRAFSMASMEPRKQYLDGMLTENTRIVSVPARIGKSASTAVASAFVEPITPNPLGQDVIEVPIEIVQRWGRQIDALRTSVELHGLTFTATIINQKDPWIVKAPSPAVASAFVEPLPLTEEAGYLEGMDRYLSPEWDIPTCPIIGKGPSDHCKHGMGNLDYCPHCEDMDLSEEEI